MRTARQIAKAMLPELAVDTLKSMELYTQAHGRLPNLLFPRTFNEKIVRRNLFDHRPILRQFADKFAVRDYVAKRLGPQLLPQLYWVTEDPADIPFDKLPGQFVVKPTCGAGRIEIIRDKSQLDAGKLIATCRDWLSRNFYPVCRERIYKDIPHRILVEELLDDGTSQVPADHKLFVFHGQVELIASVYDRFSGNHGIMRNRDWEEVDVRLNPAAKEMPHDPPQHCRALVEAAEALAQGLDFVRADLYDTPNGIYFGGLTTTPGAGLLAFHPKSFDRYLGSLW